MIIKLFHRTRDDGVNLYRTFSNEGKTIIQKETNFEYIEAVDVENAQYTYVESDRTIEEMLQELENETK